MTAFPAIRPGRIASGWPVPAPDGLYFPPRATLIVRSNPSGTAEKSDQSSVNSSCAVLVNGNRTCG